MRVFEWIIFGCCVLLFAVFQIQGLFKGATPIQLERYKPVVPDPLVILESPPPISEHPWLKLQPCLGIITPEIEHDLDALHTFSKSAAIASGNELSEEEITASLIETLLSLQEQVPFVFPEGHYNVISINESSERFETPIPFHIYQRLHVGESEIGMPIYLDVRVFDLAGIDAQELIDWHRQKLIGEEKTLCTEEGRRTYLIKGERNPVYRDPSHGLSALQGERALYLDCVIQGERLFIAHLDATEESLDAVALDLSQPTPLTLR